MKKRTLKYGALLLCTSLLLTACGSASDDKEKEKEVKVSQQEKEIKQLESDVNKLHKETQGAVTEDITEYDSLQVSELLEKQKDMSYTGLLKTFRQGFESPDDLMEKLNYTLDTGEMGDSKYSFKDNLNVVVLLDSSGSMGKLVQGKSQMQIAKETLRNFMKELPKEANVALRVYGHKGQGTDSDRDKSCKSSELVYGLEKYNSNKFESALSKVNPSGWTPTELALKDVKKDLEGYGSDKNTNIVYLVSDGVSTCYDKPVQAAKELVESESAPVVNIIGFNVDNEAKEQLVEISKVTKGEYKDVGDSAELSNEFKEVQEMAKKWKAWLKNKKGEISNSSTFNVLDIFNYAARQQKKSVLEKENMDTAIKSLAEDGKITKAEKGKLLAENEKYHSAIEQSIVEFKASLQKVNQESSEGAIKEINQLLNK